MTSAVCLLLHFVALLAFVLAAGTHPALGQAATEQHRRSSPRLQPDRTAVATETSRAAAIANAWTLLEEALKDTKPELRINAVTALGTMQRFERAAAGIERTLSDPDRDVRLAAVDAAGNLKSPLLIPALRKILDDPAADISFTASEVLWQMGDKSGEEILVEVLEGERKGAPGTLKSGLHQANRDLHSPETLALIGAEQAGYALMGPFGVGIDAARLVMKNKTSANSARVAAATLLSSDKSSRTDRQLIAALKDKDYFVRAAAARGLANFQNEATANALLTAIGDSKSLVRCMAAASYIRSSALPTHKSAAGRHSGLLPHASPVDTNPAANAAGHTESQPHT